MGHQGGAEPPSQEQRHEQGFLDVSTIAGTHTHTHIYTQHTYLRLYNPPLPPPPHAPCSEIKECFQRLSTDADTRCVIVAGAGKNFSAGLDLTDFADTFFEGQGSQDPARKAFRLKETIKPMQDSFTAVEKVRSHSCSVYISL